jgi:hypothetical protein
MDINDKYGRSAGKIWDILNNHGSLDEKKLLKTTKLRKDNFFAAIGWLAREDKISKHNNIYELNNTNLNDKIGTNAGKIWNTLKSFGEIDVPQLSDYIKIPENDVYCALGWLAREDKISGIQKKIKGFQTKFQLK